MPNGSRVTIDPLPIKNPSNMPPRKSNVIVVTAYPIRGIYYEDNNVIVAYCGCTYHFFALLCLAK